MTTTAQATAAPVELELAGQAYRMSPLTDGDWGEFERHLQSRVLMIAKQNLDGLSADDRKTLLAAAYDKACALTIASPDALAYMVTRDGAAFLVWLGLRKNHPDLTAAQVRALLADERTIAAAMDKVDDLNFDARDVDRGAKKKLRRSTAPAPTATSHKPTAGDRTSSAK